MSWDVLIDKDLRRYDKIIVQLHRICNIAWYKHTVQETVLSTFRSLTELWLYYLMIFCTYSNITSFHYKSEQTQGYILNRGTEGTSVANWRRNPLNGIIKASDMESYFSIHFLMITIITGSSCVAWHERKRWMLSQE